MSLSTHAKMQRILEDNNINTVTLEELVTAVENDETTRADVAIMIKVLEALKLSEEDETALCKNLENGGTPAKLDSVDNHLHFGSHVMLGGILCDDLYEENVEGNIEELYIACEMGCNNAMVDAGELLIKEIKNPENADHRPRLIQQIKDLMTRFANLYWSLGYINACILYIELGDFYSNLDEYGAGAVAKSFYEEAVIHFRCAQLLERFEISQHLIDVVYKGKGLQEFGWKTFDEANAEILGHVAPNSIDTLFKKANERLLELTKDNEPVHKNLLQHN